MEYLELISVPAIATIVYWVINIIIQAVYSADICGIRRGTRSGGFLRIAEHYPGGQCVCGNSRRRRKRADCYGY